MFEIDKSIVAAALKSGGDLEAVLDQEIAFYGMHHAPGDVCHATLIERLDEAVKVLSTITDPATAITVLRRAIESLRFACMEQADEEKRVWNIHASAGQVNFLIVRRDGTTDISIPKGAVANCEAYSHAVQKATGAWCIPVLAWSMDEEASGSRFWK
jgi:hypothetical protein